MHTINIDLSAYRAEYGREPLHERLGTWLFIIEGNPVHLYGSYAEAATLARLYVRVFDLEDAGVALTGWTPSGEVRANLG